MVHGDDFVAVGPRQHLKETQKTLENKYKLKTQVLGCGAEEDREVVKDLLVYKNHDLFALSPQVLKKISIGLRPLNRSPTVSTRSRGKCANKHS